MSSAIPTPTDTTYALAPATEVGSFTLRVADLARSIAFYTQLIGLTLFDQTLTTASLGTGKRVVLHLTQVVGARRQPPNTTGLYHAAILLPDRRALAVKVAQLASQGVRLGQGDHLVSEAFYLSDPDGNGLELYRDRPRTEWIWQDGQVRMATDPVDVDGLFAEIDDQELLSDPRLPDGTKLGHMHLRVGDTTLAEQFYHDVLGFDVVSRFPGAVFVSAGGYHHHIGLNAWESRGGQAPVSPSAGLEEFTIALPDRSALDQLVARVEATGVMVRREGEVMRLRDPWGTGIVLEVGAN